MTSITTIGLLRHGEPQGGQYYRGSKDEPLSTAGWQQMSAAVGQQTWHIIISSPLILCLDLPWI